MRSPRRLFADSARRFFHSTSPRRRSKNRTARRHAFERIEIFEDRTLLSVTPTIVLKDAGGTFNGNPFPASVSVTGNNNAPLSLPFATNYSTFLGGSASDGGLAITTDALGDTFVTGYTVSPNFPVTPAAYQTTLQAGSQLAGFVAKFSPSGQLLWSTYINGAEGLSIAVDNQENVYVSGAADSSFATTPGAFQTTSNSTDSAFVLKLNASGTAAIWSTFIGGSIFSEADAIAVDGSDNVYLAGDTYDTDFPTLNAIQPQNNSTTGEANAFVSELNPTGSALVFSTYLGGNINDTASAIALDSAGNIDVDGTTSSTNLATTPGALQPTYPGGSTDAFVAQLTAGGTSLGYLTYLGGSVSDTSSNVGMAVDAAGDVYVTGTTESPDFPTVNAYQGTLSGSEDAYVAELNPTGTALVNSTYFGGSSTTTGSAIALDSAGNVYISGQTTSPDLPLANPVNTTGDYYVAELDLANATLLNSTYFGSSQDQGLYEPITVDSSGRVVMTGDTSSSAFPTTPNAFQPNYGGGSTNAFVVGFEPAGLTLAYYSGTSASGTPLPGAPSDVGTYTVVATFTSTDPNYANAQSAPVTFTISPPAQFPVTPTVAVDDGGVYNGQPFAATGLSFGPGGSAASGSLTFTYYVGSTASGTGSTTAPTNVGTYTVVAAFTSSDPDYTNAQSTPLTFTISSATPQVVVYAAGGTYNGNPFPASATTVGVDVAPVSGSFSFIYYYGNSVSGTGTSTAPTAAGTYTVVADFTSADSNYTNAESAPVTFTIYPPGPRAIFNNITYDNGPVTSDGEEEIQYYPPAFLYLAPLADSFSTAGAGTLTDVQLVLGLNPTYDYLYDRAATIFVSLYSTSSTPDSITGYPQPGTLLANLGSVPETSLTTSLAVYDFPVSNIALAGNTLYWIELSTDDDGAAAWSYSYFGGGTGEANNYVWDQNGSDPDSLAPGTFQMQVSGNFATIPAAPTVLAGDGGGTYNGNPFPASAIATGAGGVGVSGSFAFTYYAGTSASGTGTSTAPTDAGTYTVVADFTSADPNYANADSAPVTFTISQATPTVVATDAGGTYDGNPFPASAIATGVGGVGVSGSFAFTYYVGSTVSGTGTSTAPIDAGTYTVVADFTSGDPNYTNADSAPVIFTITATQETPTVVATDAGGTYNGNPFPASATATGVGGASVTGSFAFTYYVGSTVSGNGSSTAPTDAGTYTVVADFTSGDPNYTNADSAPVTFTISQAMPTVVATDDGGTYDDNPFPASATATGVGGASVSGSFAFTYYVGSTVSGNGSSTAPTNAGMYTVVAAFTSDDTNYTNADSAPVTFIIGQATPAVVATDAGGTYNGNPFPASATATGVGGASVSGSFAFTYYVGSAVSGNGSSTAPTNAGTYTVVAAFTSADSNYTNADSAPVTFTISQATPTVVATDAGGTYNGNPFSASATATGVGGASVSGSFVFTYYVGSTVNGTGSSAAPTNAGTYTVVAAFTSTNTNYTGAQSSPVTFTIVQATPTVVATDAGGTYNGNAFPASATATGVGGALVSGSFAFTYYVGSTVSGTGSSTAPSNTGTYTVVAAFASSNTNYTGAQSSPVTFTIGQATPTVVATDAGGTYSGNPFPASATATGVGGASVSGSFAFTYYVGSTANGTGSSTAPSNAGTYTVVAAFASSNTNYTGAQSSPVTFTIGQATPSVVATDAGGTYNGNAFPASAAATGVGGASVIGSFAFTYYLGSTVSGTGSSTAPTNAGTYTVIAAFTSSNTNYTGAQSSPVTFTIGQATPSVVATDAGGTYNGNPFPATATAKGVGGASVSGSFAFTYYVGSTVSGTGSSTAPTNAGTYTVVAGFTSSNANYASAQSSPVTFTIGQATPTVVATDAGGTYNGNPFAASATAKGVGGASVSGSFAFTYYVGSTVSGTGSSTAPSNAGTYTVVAAFTSSNTNYTGAQSSPVTFTIGQATPSVVAIDAGGTYNGNAFPASAAATGVGGASVTGSFAFTYYVGSTVGGTGSSTAPINAGTYTVVAAFTSSNTNYTGAQSSPVTFTIGQATPTVVATDAGGTYNGNPFAATATAKGVGGVSVSGTFAFTYYVGNTVSGTGSSTAPTNAGTYTVVAAFTSSNANYASAQSSAVTFAIGQATPTVVATDAGGTYNGNSFPASATATGVGGASVSGSFAFTYYVGSTVSGTGSSTAPTNAGTYTVVAAFTSSNTNYTGAQSSPVTFTIGQATPSVVATDAGGTYNGNPFAATATAKGVGGASVSGSFAFTYYVGSTVSGTGSSTAPTNAGTYTVVAAFTSSNTNYTGAQSSPVTLTIGQATPTVVATDAGGTYNGNPFAATATAKGVGGASVSGSFAFTYYVGSTVSGTGSSTAPSNAGTYTVVAAFTSSNTNYAGAQSSPVTFTIGQAIPVVVATDAGGPYNGNPYPASATATGVGGASVSGTFAFTYYVGSTVNGTGSSTAPTNVGTYTVVAAFTSANSNYTNAQSAPVTFSIGLQLGLLLLDPSSSGALDDTGSSTITVNGGGAIVVDSNSSTAAIASGSSTVTATDIDVVGGIKSTGSGGFSGSILHTSAMADPLGLSLPSAPSTTFSAVNYSSGSPLTLSPGTYVGGIKLSGSAKVTLQPGVYYLKGGGFSAAGDVSVTGTGVLLVNAPAQSTDTINVLNSATVNLSPSSSLSGAYASYDGITILQTPTSTNAITVSGSAVLTVSGVLYAPKAPVDVTLSGQFVVNSDSAYSRAEVVVADLSVTGDSSVTINVDPPGQGAVVNTGSTPAATPLATGTSGTPSAAVNSEVATSADSTDAPATVDTTNTDAEAVQWAGLNSAIDVLNS